MSGGPFRFGLQRVLDLRAKREQEVATALVAAQGAAERARVAVQALEALRDAGRERALGGHSASGTVGELRHLGYVVELLDRRVRDAEGAALEADAVVDEAQRSLRAAFQDRRVLDRLRDKQLDAHRTAEVQTDRQMMDDIALARFGRRADT